MGTNWLHLSFFVKRRLALARSTDYGMVKMIDDEAARLHSGCDTVGGLV